jgi:hypothetical protein
MNLVRGTLLYRESSGITRGTALLLLDIDAESSIFASADYVFTKQNVTFGQGAKIPMSKK